ncbi:hypothetical protein ACFSY7_15495 [Kurthia populi]|uniref:Uncharacterized protein n=1 Tax=Kurthia populi TaxID=1562132 RepID=A0ABW5Y4A3_9BACL
MAEKTTEQYEATITRLNSVIKNMASSTADDAILIAELQAIISEDQEILQHLQTENQSLKQAITQAAKEGDDEVNEVTTGK